MTTRDPDDTGIGFILGTGRWMLWTTILSGLSITIGGIVGGDDGTVAGGVLTVLTWVIVPAYCGMKDSLRERDQRHKSSNS